MKTHKAAVIGTGMIGAGFTSLLLYHGIPTSLISRSAEGCAKGYDAIVCNLDDFKALGLIRDDQVQRCLSRLTITTDMNEIADATTVFESVPEILAIKKVTYGQIERIVDRRTAILSMTSSLSPDELSCGMQRPERFIVTHPWNPAHFAPCVEVVKSAWTDADTLAEALAILERLDRKVIVLRKNIEGFIGNRIQHAMYREALHLINMGVATAEEIDQTILYSFGQRFAKIGLMEYFDSVGLDLQFQVQSYLFPTLCNAIQPQAPLVDRYAAGELGLKTGEGIIDWSHKDIEDFRKRKSSGFYQFARPYREDSQTMDISE